MAESDHWEPYRAHDQVHIAIPSAVDKTAATNQPGDTQYTGGTHQEDAGLRFIFSANSGAELGWKFPPLFWFKYRKRRRI